jgi:hypothetical protein
MLLGRKEILLEQSHTKPYPAAFGGERMGTKPGYKNRFAANVDRAVNFYRDMVV